VAPWLGPEWWIDPEPGHLMTTPLTPIPLPAPPTGYTARTWTRSGVTRTGVLAATPAGRALYETLGRHTEATLTSAKFQGRDRDGGQDRERRCAPRSPFTPTRPPTPTTMRT